MSMRCPTCGTVYPDDAKFCTKDGGRLLAKNGTPITPAVVAPGATNAAASADPADAPAPNRATTPRANTPAVPQKTEFRHSSLAGQVLDGRYAIVKKVGEGGMSYVYLAHDVSTNERYAIKVLSPALSDDANAMARLRREASLGIRLAHPNVCHIVRMGETEDGLADTHLLLGVSRAADPHDVSIRVMLSDLLLHA